eukprot:Skav235991  [mRNA]  locus=scaffold348:199530:200497:+ [translate_table: standard]
MVGNGLLLGVTWSPGYAKELLGREPQGARARRGARHLPRLHHLRLQDVHHRRSRHVRGVLLWLPPDSRWQVRERQHDLLAPGHTWAT